MQHENFSILPPTKLYDFYQYLGKRSSHISSFKLKSAKMNQQEKNIRITKKMEKQFNLTWLEIWKKYSSTLLCEYFRREGGRCIRCSKTWCNTQTFKLVKFNVQKLICYKCKKELKQRPRWSNKCQACQKDCGRLQHINNQKVCDTCYMTIILNN